MAIGPNISGTLSGLDAQTLSQALEEELRKQLAGRTQQATQEAQQAESAFGQAAAAPTPDIGPLAAFLPQLLGNVASVLGQTPAYREQAGEAVQTSRAQLLKQRADNIQALKEMATQKADAAQKAGDIESAETSRLQIEKYSRLQDQLLEQQRQFGRMELAKEEGKTARDVAGIRARETVADAQKETVREQRRLGQAITSIGTAVRQDPDVKNFVTVRDQFQMGLSGSQGKSNLGDILLMRAIARVSDPLSSVREEEFRTFKGAQGVLAQHGVNLTRGMWGRGMLNDFGRQQMVSQLRSIYANKKLQYDRAYNQYRMSAAAQGVPEELVLRDYTAPEAVEEPTSPGNAPPQGKVMVLSPKGKRFEIDASELPEAIKRGWKRTQ